MNDLWALTITERGGDSCTVHDASPAHFRASLTKHRDWLSVHESMRDEDALLEVRGFRNEADRPCAHYMVRHEDVLSMYLTKVGKWDK